VGPGAGQQHTTNPGARLPTQGLPLVNRFATSATRATKYTSTCCSLLHCFSYHFTPYCISRIGVYVHRPSEIPPLRITSGSFLQNAEWPSLTRLLPCFPIQTFLQLISQFKPVLPGGLFTPDPLTSGFQALTASKSQQADHFQLSPQPNQQLYTSTSSNISSSRAAWGPKFQRSHSGRIPACAS
jgi:hypothetical protein